MIKNSFGIEGYWSLLEEIRKDRYMPLIETHKDIEIDKVVHLTINIKEAGHIKMGLPLGDAPQNNIEARMEDMPSNNKVVKTKDPLDKPLRIEREGLPERCEICHQTDMFDPNNNHCDRCHTKSDTMTINKHMWRDIDNRYNNIVLTSNMINDKLINLQKDFDHIRTLYGRDDDRYPTTWAEGIYRAYTFTLKAGLAAGTIYFLYKIAMLLPILASIPQTK